MKKKYKIIAWIIILIVLFVVIHIFVTGVLTLFESKFKLTTSLFLNGLININYLLISFVIVGAIMGYILYERIFKTNNEKKVLSRNKNKENVHFLTEKEMLKDKNRFRIVKYSELDKVSDGIPISAIMEGDDAKITLLPPNHTIIVGATGTGKTTAFIMPTINILSRTKTKPTIILTDPKGELYRDTYLNLKNQGYKVLLIDFSDPFISLKWNPFAFAISKLKEFMEARDEAIIQNLNKYFYRNVEYRQIDKATLAKDTVLNQLSAIVRKEVEDVINTLFKVESQSDPFWEKSAKSFIGSIAQQFVELIKDGDMPIEKFTLFNLYQNINEYATPEMEDKDSVMRKFFEVRPSNARALAKGVLDAQEKTLTSMLTNISDYMNWLSDPSIQAITSGDDLNFHTFDEEPTALFIKLNITSNTQINNIASVMITQLYKSLTTKAENNFKKGEMKEGKLKRHCYFLIDEFANIPKIEMVGKIVTYGRGFGITFIPVVQDYSQLDSKYEKVGKEIRSNENTTIFLGTAHQETLKEISEALGKKLLPNFSMSGAKDVSYSYGTQEESLLPPSELRALNSIEIGNVIVIGMHNPRKGKFTPIFKATNVYGEIKQIEKDIDPIEWDINEQLFDIVKYIGYSNEKFDDYIANEQDELIRTKESKDETQEDINSRLILSLEEKIANVIRSSRYSIPKDYYEDILNKPIEEKLKIIEIIIKKAQELNRLLVVKEMVRLKLILENIRNELNNLFLSFEEDEAEAPGRERIIF